MPITHLNLIKDTQGKILTKVTRDQDDQKHIQNVQEEVDHAAAMAKELAKNDEDRRKASMMRKAEEQNENERRRL